MATKILLVEDDKSLREIYGVRLQAEGYDIVSANDGEQALAVAIKERPGLIITDVMMPKISGFDMLDILRSTAETKDIKVIMMTALSSDDQRTRGERMGADRYLVKSQVGIEDVVRTVHEVLGDSSASAAPAAAPPPMPSTSQVPSPIPPPTAPVASTTTNPDTPGQTPPPMPPAPAMITTQPTAAGPSASQPSSTPMPTSTTPIPPQTSSVPSAPSAKQRVIQPINDLSNKVDINELLDKELAKEAGIDINNRPQVASTDQEKAVVREQIQAASQPTPQSTTTPPTLSTPPVATTPTERPATPNVPQRDTPLQAPPRIPTI